MSYATASITSTTPGKDLMAALGTPLTGAGLTLVESYNAPAFGVWSGLAYGAGLFVTAANGTATAATSPDGITWTARTLPAVAAWTAVTYGNGQFVAVAQGVVAATSPDGITWTQRALPSSQTWTSVTYGGGLYLAVATGTAAATSPDGITWTARTLPTSAAWTAVTYGSAKFVLVATNSGSYSSADGITWTARSGPVSYGLLCYGGGLFVTGGYNTASLSTSPDGITWTSRALPMSSLWFAVVYSGTQFLALCWSGVVATSPDGITWTQRTGPPAVSWTSAAYGAGTYVVTNGGGSTTLAASTSTDGTTWTARTLTGTANTATSDVYKSPSAANQFGQDWYLILSRANDYAGLNYQVAENYTATTHTASTYGGRGQAVVPVAGTFANPLPPYVVDASIAAGSALLTLTTTAFTYWVSANANRVIIAVKTSTEQGFYAGLYDDLLPAGTTQFPLACAKFPIAQTGPGAIGSNSAPQTGGYTREPGQYFANATNFEATIHSGYWGFSATGVPLGSVVPGNYTPMTSAAPLYGNPCSLSRAIIGTTRLGATVGDGMRGLLIGCVTSAVSSAAGDTTTVGGKTYVRFTGPTTTFGFFVDNSL